MIELINLKKQYGELVAVDGINLKVNPGEIYGFLGPNGAGKTTTIRMITGILPASSGEVLIDALSLKSQPMECKRITGYVPDRPFIYEKLKAWEFLQFVCDLYSLNRETTLNKADELLALFQLSHAKYRLIEDFSHGMKQKLVIISSLLSDPKLLVIDEPMVGLDPKGATILKALFRQLASAGKTIFLSTHTMSVAEELCDRISIIHSGKIKASGTMTELRNLGKGDENLEQIFLKITEEEVHSNAAHPLS
ncbi:MAG: ABC transporter ATP-binding protein [Candidatus Cloacimonetes bacterium]|nr:ABC transporter ATP-binding protein [Candidatus Cloacimonadota bacterium]